MTWGARAGRAAALCLLAVLWAGAAHLLVVPHHASSPAALVAPLAWAGTTTGLLAWWVAPLARGRRVARTAALALVLGAGQLLTHASLSVEPLLAAQTREPMTSMATLHGHGMHQHLGAVTGLPGIGDVLQAMLHGGPLMLLAHLAASVAAATAWGLAGALWGTARTWWGRVRPQLIRPLPARRGLVLQPAPVPHVRLLHFPWEGRGPPVLAG